MSLKPNEIYHIDVTEGLSKIDDEVADIIIIDPPYNIGKNFGVNKDNLSLKEYSEWATDWITESIRILKPGGSMFIYGYSEILSHISVQIPLDKRWLIWSYTNKNSPAVKFWQRSHESIIHTWKDKPIFNIDDVRVPYSEAFLKGSAGNKRKPTEGRFNSSGKETTFNVNPGGACPRDVLHYPALVGPLGGQQRWFLDENMILHHPSEIKNFDKTKIIKHPTQKPMQLTQNLIKSSHPKTDGLVVVPFSGSGSECFVAKQLGLDIIGFDNNEDWVNMGNQLLNADWDFKL